jgi:WD40 associated region in TFIID subunit, NTD2 domain
MYCMLECFIYQGRRHSAPDVVIQAEMTKVLWPVFLHCYLGLVKRNATAEAHQLMTKHKGRFTAGTAASSQHTQVCLGVDTLTADAISRMRHEYATQSSSIALP